jgi:hypothetical protein
LLSLTVSHSMQRVCLCSISSYQSDVVLVALPWKCLGCRARVLSRYQTFGQLSNLLLPRTVTSWYTPEKTYCGETAQLWAFSTSSSNCPDGSAWYTWAIDEVRDDHGSPRTQHCEGKSGVLQSSRLFSDAVAGRKVARGISMSIESR